MVTIWCELPPGGWPTYRELNSAGELRGCLAKRAVCQLKVQHVALTEVLVRYAPPRVAAGVALFGLGAGALPLLSMSRLDAQERR